MNSPLRLPLLLASALAATAFATAPLAAQAPPNPPGTSPGAPPASIQDATRPGQHTSLSSCANGACHGADAPRALAPGEPETILGNEFTSRLLDPHFRATAVLRNELSREIAAAVAPGRKPWQMAECLACHGSDQNAIRQGLIDVDDGISCQSCHGPAGGWGNRHFEQGWTHKDSVAAGLRDLRDPVVRAQTCMGCHLGEPGREVDHRLLAAGHPKLGFDLDNYSELPELRHWLPDARRAARDGRPVSHGLRAWGVGQVVAFEESLALLAQRAESSALWPEFTELSCSSCHHSVGDGAWRRQPGYRFRGGLPPWSAAKWSVLRELLAVATPEQLALVEQKVEALGQLVGSFGNRAEIVRQAKALDQELDPIRRKVAGLDWSGARIRAVVAALAAQRDTLSAEPQVARQTAWALHSLLLELAQQDRRVLRGGQLRRVDELFDLVEAPAFDRGRFAAVLAGLQ
jgi:hypothetical protein